MSALHAVCTGRSLFRALILFQLLVGVGGGAARPALAEDVVRRYLDGLRERRMYSVAESYCLKRLASNDLPERERADLTVELSRCLSEHATLRSGREQDELWDQATSVIAELLQQQPQTPRRLVLELQAALVEALRGEHLRWQAALFPHDAELSATAIAALTTAAQKLADVEQAARSAAGTPGETSAELGAAELREVAQDAGFRAAVVAAALAALQPPGVERTAALHDADERLAMLARANLPDAMQASVRLLRARTARLRGELDQARSLTKALLSAGDEASFLDQVRGEAARIELAAGRPDEALRLLSERQAAFPAVGELQLLTVEAYLAARSAAVERNDEALARKLLAEAERVAGELQGAWQQAGAEQLAIAREASLFGADLAAMVTEGRAAFARGEKDQALGIFGRAIDEARATGRSKVEAELLQTRGAILLQGEQYDEAAEDFRASSARGTAGAAQAHLLYAFCLGKLWEQNATRARREAFAAALEDHLARYAGDASAAEALWMLAVFEERRQQWTRALSLYERIPADDARSGPARARIAALYERILERLSELQRPAGEWEERAATVLDRFVAEMPAPPRGLSVFDAETALRLARILLNREPPDYAAVEKLLDRVAESSQLAEREAARTGQAADAAWGGLLRSTLPLRIIALAGAGQVDEAGRLLESVAVAEPQPLLQLLAELSDVGARSRPEVRRTLGELQLRAAQRLGAHRDELDASAQRLLDVALARASVAAGRVEEAMAVYERLLSQSPQDRALLRTAAVFLTDVGGKVPLERAIAYWQRLEALQRRGTPAWLEVRWQLAACCLKAGRVADARRLVNVARALHPELGGDELRRKFDDLQAEIERVKSR